MSQPYVGQLLLVPYNFAPVGWMFCQGQLLSISENETLFQLIGTTFGGDGQSTFALPDLRGRTAIGTGQGAGAGNYVLGQTQGVEQVTLTSNQIPTHTHVVVASGSVNNSSLPNGAILAATSGAQAYASAGTAGNLAPGSLSPVGGSQPHDNLQPYLTLNWIISLFGIFPTQS
ncbi:MAG: phage tail protein [Bryobacterales bacterium]|nr:phage tail protein [Bryobacterales bacterium]